MSKRVLKNVDLTSKKYFERNEVFADIVNYVLFRGKPVVNPEKLKALDRTEEIWILKKVFTRSRDVFKCVFKEDGEHVFMLIGIESQSFIDHSMVIRSFFADALNLMHQVQRIESSEATAETDFLSRMVKGQKLIPVSTVVVYLGEKTWDAPCELWDYYEGLTEEMKEFLPNYKLNLFCPRTMNEEDLNKFHSHIKATMGYIRYSEEKAKLEDFVLSEVAFQTIPRDAVELINTVSELPIKLPKNKKASVNMCKAIIEMREEAKKLGQEEGEKRGFEKGEKRGFEKGEKRGFEKGRKEGIKEGIEKGIEKGEKRGLEMGLLDAIRSLMLTMQTTASEAMQLLRIPAEKFEYYSAKLAMNS